MISKAQEGKYTLEGFVELANVDMKSIEGGNVDMLVLTSDEKQAVKMLKDYEERARQQRMYGDDNRNIEGNRDGNSTTDSDESTEDDILIFGYKIQSEKLGLPFVAILFTIMSAVFYYCSICITYSL